MDCIREELGETILKMRQLAGTAPRKRKTIWQKLRFRKPVNHTLFNGLADELENALETVAGRAGI